MKIKSTLLIVGMASSVMAAVPKTTQPEGSDQGLTLARGQVHIPQALSDRDMQIHYAGGAFTIQDDAAQHVVSASCVKGVPNNLTTDQLEGFLKHGHMFLTERDGEYGLEARVSGKGGDKFSAIVSIIKLIAENAPKLATKVYSAANKGSRKIFSSTGEAMAFLKNRHDKLGTGSFLMEIDGIYDFSSKVVHGGASVLESVLSLFPETESKFESKRDFILADLESKSGKKQVNATGFLLDQIFKEAIMQERRGGIDIAGDMERARRKQVEGMARRAVGKR